MVADTMGRYPVKVIDQSNEAQWYTVRCVLQSTSVDGFVYEERLTLWQAESIDQAIAVAEAEAAEHAGKSGSELLGLAQACWLAGQPISGAEIYSLMRESELGPDDYLDSFFDTGRERQSDSDEQ